MLEWQELCSHAIWVTVGIFVVPYAGLQICRGFYYLDEFPRFNRVCRGVVSCSEKSSGWHRSRLSGLSV